MSSGHKTHSYCQGICLRKYVGTILIAFSRERLLTAFHVKLYWLDDRDVQHSIMSFIDPFKFHICLATHRIRSCRAHRIQRWNKIFKASKTTIIIAIVLVLIFTFSLEILDINYMSHSTVKMQSIIKELKSDLGYFTTSIR